MDSFEYIVVMAWGSRRIIYGQPGDKTTALQYAAHLKQFYQDGWAKARDEHKRRAPEPVVRIYKLVSEHRPPATQKDGGQ